MELNRNCLHCSKKLGLKGLAGARFCSEEHANADQQQVQALMVQRLKHAGVRLQAKVRRAKDALTLAIAS